MQPWKFSQKHLPSRKASNIHEAMPEQNIFTLHPDTEAARKKAQRLFERTAETLRPLLPANAQIHHIGATALPNCLTKGDLDVVIRVPESRFTETDALMAGRYPRNTGSTRTATFSAFEDGTTTPNLGLQLTAVGGPNDFFHTFVEILTQNPELVERYNTLKRAYVGQPMDVYRRAKDAFIADVLKQHPATDENPPTKKLP